MMQQLNISGSLLLSMSCNIEERIRQFDFEALWFKEIDNFAIVEYKGGSVVADVFHACGDRKNYFVGSDGLCLSCKEKCPDILISMFKITYTGIHKKDDKVYRAVREWKD